MKLPEQKILKTIFKNYFTITGKTVVIFGRRAYIETASRNSSSKRTYGDVNTIV